MPTSWMVVTLIALSASQLGRCAEAPALDQGDGSFQIKDLMFNHVWHTKTVMPDKRSDMSATTIGDAIYLVGGCALDQVWVPDPPYPSYVCGGSSGNAITGATLRYFPKTDSYDTSLPHAPRPRYRHAAAAVDDQLFLFGGVDGSDNIISEVDVLNTANGKWSTLSKKMPNATTDLSAIAYDGLIYTIGGYNTNWEALTVTQIFDPTKDGGSWQVGPSLLQGRGDAFAAVVGSKAYVGGGFHHENYFEMPVKSLEMLHIGQSNAFVPMQDMGMARGDKAVAVLNGILHVVGGETKNADGHSVPLKDVEAYDPDGNSWYKGGAIPSHRFRFVAAAHGDSIFIFGGQGYLVGTYGEAGSKYPVLGTVEEYRETVVVAEVNAASSSLPDFGCVSFLAYALYRFTVGW